MFAQSPDQTAHNRENTEYNPDSVYKSIATHVSSVLKLKHPCEILPVSADLFWSVPRSIWIAPHHLLRLVPAPSHRVTWHRCSNVFHSFEIRVERARRNFQEWIWNETDLYFIVVSCKYRSLLLNWKIFYPAKLLKIYGTRVFQEYLFGILRLFIGLMGIFIFIIVAKLLQ